jgi:L-threonylcarbamoyladenylate synthase
MSAIIERLTGASSDDAVLARAGDLIRRGELVAFPTETVYGLGANAFDEGAVGKIFEAKGRPFADPLIVHLADARDAAGVTSAMPSAAKELMRVFWPGPLTLIVPRGDRIPTRVTAGRDTVAIRVPRHPVAHALLKAAGVPIAAPSANRFSRPSPTTAAHVAEDRGDRIDLILDGGPTTHGVESTVLDLTSERPLVLRPGAVTLVELRKILPAVILGAEFAAADFKTSRPYDSTGESLKSPGTSLKHYSPRAEVRFWTGEPEAARQALRLDAGQAIAAGRRVGALVFDEDVAAFDGLDVTLARLGSTGDLSVAAARLYDGLRTLDRAGVDVILARDPGERGLALTIRDRLFRAAEGRVLDTRA